MSVSLMNRTDGPLGPPPPEDAITDVFALLSVVLGCYLSIPVTLVGSVGNTMTLIVFGLQKNKDTNTLILLSLALCDFYYATNQFARKLSCVIKPFDPILANAYFVYSTIYVWLTGRYFFTCSVGHITLIGIERYIAVHYPFKAAVYMSRRNLCIGLSILYISVGAMLLPAFAIWEIRFTFNEEFNQTVPTLTYSDTYVNKLFVYDWYNTFNNIVWTLIIYPVNGLVVFFLAVSVSLKVRALARDRTKLSATSKTSTVDIRSTLMTLSITIVCLISLCPVFGFHLYIYFRPPSGGQFSLMVFYDTEEFISAINASVNVFIYMFLSKKFNSGMKKLFACQSN